jgi:hypothetical protein
MSDDLANAQSELTAAQEKVEALLTAEEATPPFTPMDDPNKKKDDEATFSSDSSGLRAAAAELQQHRQAAAEPIGRGYNDSFGEGEPALPHLTVTTERAARDLGEIRQAEQTIAENDEIAEVQRQVDALRAEEAGQQPQPDLTPQPEAPPAEEPAAEATPSTEPKWKALLNSDPEFRAEMDAIVQGHAAEKEQQRQIVEAAIQQTAQIQGAAILADYPELHGLSGPAIDGALRIFQQKEPQRHAALMQRAMHMQQTIAQAQQFQAARAPEAQGYLGRQEAQFKAWAASQDEAFEASIKDEAPEVIQAAKKGLPKLLQERYGIKEDDLHALWNGSPAFRSAGNQRLMLDAWRFNQAREAVSKPRPQRTVPVQRPGVSGERPTYDQLQFAAQRKAFESDPNPRTAAKLLAARRAAAARG